MVRKSYGKMRGTRKKLVTREKPGINVYMKRFELGNMVRVVLNPGKTTHPKFHGSTGKIIEKQGRNYLVAVRNKKAVKKIVLRPEQLRILD